MEIIDYSSRATKVSNLESKNALSLRSIRGMTVLELLITLSFTSIALAISVPALSNLQKSSTFLKSRGETLLNTKALRELAITNNAKAVMCTIDDEGKCNGIENQLVAFIDTNKNNTLDAFEQSAFRFRIDGDITWRKDNRPISFNSKGWMSSQTGTLRVCLSDDRGYQIIISRTGRIRSLTTSDHCIEE